MTTTVLLLPGSAGQAKEREVQVGGLVEPYVRGRVRRGEIAVLTARNVRMVLGQFTAVNPTEVDRLSRRHVLRWLDTTEHLAQSTRRNRLTVVRSFTRWLVDERYVKIDPCRKVPSLREPKRAPRALPGEQVAAILDACPDRRARLCVLLMVQLGLRRGEVARLEVGNMDLTNELMVVTGKGGHQRVLPITEQAKQAIRDYLSEVGDIAGPLVRSYQFLERGLHPDTVSAIVRRAMWEAGVKRAARDGVSPHALRHSALTDMLRHGAHIRDVQAAAGHRHISTTETYLPLLVSTLGDAMSGRWYGHTS